MFPLIIPVITLGLGVLAGFQSHSSDSGGGDGTATDSGNSYTPPSDANSLMPAPFPRVNPLQLGAPPDFTKIRAQQEDWIAEKYFNVGEAPLILNAEGAKDWVTNQIAEKYFQEYLQLADGVYHRTPEGRSHALAYVSRSIHVDSERRIWNEKKGDYEIVSQVATYRLNGEVHTFDVVELKSAILEALFRKNKSAN